MNSSQSRPLLTVRATVVFLAAVVVGVVAGVLSYLDSASVSQAVLVGAGAAGSAVLLLHSIIGDDERSAS
ncbi:hypothetical protein AB0J80_27690 [Actinoplanes sp. NPDC049548]|uniref:hypothetical protein n=1 Tax=Actinoplanes sp. NPDC049548 TaxID=3155152 RepID=UPI0034398F43